MSNPYMTQSNANTAAITIQENENDSKLGFASEQSFKRARTPFENSRVNMSCDMGRQRDKSYGSTKDIHEQDIT